ncbi:MAG: NeuD/PglB/VioB family sugar acetyltransferase [Synergistaceae bacterium]|jgi:sugar O-acyltransferase (sialic acid O-acetyltransferase NeuD family)|nr:NeuD/PglB/VioB family sugar acetyltransferase [Synergistaceae bacterium]
MHDLVIYGAGGLGQEMEGLVRATDPGGRMWNFLGFIDDSLSVGTMVSGYPVLGGRERLTSRTTPTAVAMGLTSPSVRADLYASLTRNPGIIFPTLVHPLAYVEASASLAPGAIVSPFCFVAVNASIGVCSFLNVSSQVGHDSVVGDFCAIMPGVGISGNVKIGARALIGAGAKILQGLSVGSDTVVGIGSVVLNDVPDYCTVMGYPARVIKKGG